MGKMYWGSGTAVGKIMSPPVHRLFRAYNSLTIIRDYLMIVDRKNWVIDHKAFKQIKENVKCEFEGNPKPYFNLHLL